jgi:hypothetical protein
MSLPVSAGSLRADNPMHACYNPDWSTITPNSNPSIGPYDPYAILDGNSDGKQDSATFFSPGTQTTQAAIVCLPQVIFAVGTYLSAGDSPNPASQPQQNPDQTDCVNNVPQNCGAEPTIAALTATGGVMYEWINATDTDLTPDAEVIVWNLPASTVLPSGALELEFDNWCSINDGGAGSAPALSSASFTWNGNFYDYPNCATFSGVDLLLNSSGVLIGYVNSSNVTVLASAAPGWQVGYATTTTLNVSPNPAKPDTCVTFQSVVSGLPGAPLPTGSVTFFNGSKPIGAVVLNEGSASFSTYLSPGKYSITASYSGNATTTANYSAASESAPYSLTVARHDKGEPKTSCGKT